MLIIVLAFKYNHVDLSGSSKILKIRPPFR